MVDADGQLLGILPPEALMEVLRAEHLEDLHRLSGVRRDEMMARQAIEGPPLRRARDRLPWLLVGLAGGALVTVVMALFESTLASTVAVAFFVPGIVYLADAIGTQTEAAAVRGLSLVHEPLRQLVWGELRTGVLMGVTLAAVALPAVAGVRRVAARRRRGRCAPHRRSRGHHHRAAAALATRTIRPRSGVRKRAAGYRRSGRAQHPDLPDDHFAGGGLASRRPRHTRHPTGIGAGCGEEGAAAAAPVPAAREANTCSAARTFAGDQSMQESLPNGSTALRSIGQPSSNDPSVTSRNPRAWSPLTIPGSASSVS